MLTTDSVILGVGIILVLVALVDMWQIRYENKMRDKRNSEGSGMVLGILSRTCNLFLAIGVCYFLLVPNLLWLLAKYLLEEWEQTETLVRYTRALGIFELLIAIAVYGYSWASRIVYDRKKIVVNKLFKVKKAILWEMLGSIELQANYSICYDRDGQVCLKVPDNAETEHLCRSVRAKVEENVGESGVIESEAWRILHSR